MQMNFDMDNETGRVINIKVVIVKYLFYFIGI